MNKKNRAYLIAAICALIIWHMLIAFSGSKRLTGLFTAVPKEGYTWTNGTTKSRLFWSGMSAQWTPGLNHPKYKAYSGLLKGSWLPLPGYAYTYGTDMSTIYWQAGLQHPAYKVISLTSEGQWFPLPGYKFMFPGTSLAVQWTPGVISPGNANLISGEDEDEWVDIDNALEDASYSITVTFPGCTFTDFSNFLYSCYIAANPVNGLIQTVFQKNLLEGYELVTNNLLGGMPIPGNLTITRNYLEYEPAELMDWFINGDSIRKIRIPAGEIRSVSREDNVLYGVVIVEMENVKVRFAKLRDGPGEPGSTIREKIDLMLAYYRATHQPQQFKFN